MSTPESPLLTPGITIELAGMHELGEFEDVIAPVVDPKCNQDYWFARPRLKELLRPAGFNGNLSDVNLTVMDYPTRALVDAKNRGGTLLNQEGRASTGSIRLDADTADGAQLDGTRYIGVRFSALAHSGVKQLGSVGANIWYLPNVDSNRVYQTGWALRRFMTRPEYSKEAFEARLETSKTIGFQVLRRAMMYPIVTPHRS